MLLVEILAPDYKLYNHFVAKFRQTLDTFTDTRMAEELAELDRWKIVFRYLLTLSCPPMKYCFKSGCLEARTPQTH